MKVSAEYEDYILRLQMDDSDILFIVPPLTKFDQPCLGVHHICDSEARESGLLSNY